MYSYHSKIIHLFLRQHLTRYELCSEISTPLPERRSEDTADNSEIFNEQKSICEISSKSFLNAKNEVFTSFPMTATQTAILY